MAHDPSTPKPGVTRRKFLTYTAGAGALLGASPLLRWPGSTAEAARRRKMETHTYFFNFSHIETSNHDLILVAGKNRVRLTRVNRERLRQAREDHPILTYVPDAHFTHQVKLKMPANALQLCYVQRVKQGKKDGQWDIAHLFYHHPITALREAHRRGKLRAGLGHPKVHVKWLRYGITPELRTALNDPVGEAMLQDTTDQATALVAGHPELACGEPNSAADIQGNIIGTQPATAQLGQIVAAQGPATPTGGWATQTPLINPDTGQVALNSQGQIQYMPVWSQTTGQFTGSAISPALDTVKDDPTLGSNITTVDPTTLPDYDPNATDNGPTTGTVWTLHDGDPTVEQATSTALAQATTLPFQFIDQTPGHGYRLEIEDVGVDGNGNRTVTFSAKNWFVRYLSLFVRYLDGNGQPIPLSNIASQVQSGFPLWNFAGANGTYDAFLDMVGPEWVFLGIPVKATDIKKTIPIPPQAASVLILGGGLGSGNDPYPVSVTPGKTMTAIFNLSVPLILLSFAAAAGFNFLTKALEDSETLREVLDIAISLFGPIFEGTAYDNPEAFKDIGVEIGQKLLSSAAGKIDQLIAESIAEGETIEAVEDAIPIIGGFLSALWAISLVAEVTETSAQVNNSPKSYIDEVAFTHDITVTVAHDPQDPAGFPATATYYIVTAIFDGGSPKTTGKVALPGATVTQPIPVTFTDVPAGGQVKVDVGFYSNTGFLVGNGSVGPVKNDPTKDPQSLSIAITEVLIPLTPSTVYSHKEVIALDASGNHIWHATTTPPAVQTPLGVCTDANGNICSWTDITVSTVTASVGYAWESYNTAVTDWVSGGLGQLHQFANISVTEAPQSGYLFSGKGFSGVTRIVYDLLGQQGWNFYLDPTDGNNFIRQIRLSVGGPSTYDSPLSNKAFGRLQFPSDALLLHPLGKIVSINSSLSKLEVLDLPAAAVADTDAPLSQVRSGVGTREGLMNGPIHAAITAQGALLVLEQNNNRIQAFDLGGNPVPYFANGAYFVPLKDPAGTAVYLDLAVEYSGYLYVLSYTGSGPFTYHLDIYTPDGAWLARTSGMNADKLAVNYWRDLFTLNYQVLKLPNGTIPNRTEPSVSHWIPSTP